MVVSLTDVQKKILTHIRDDGPAKTGALAATLDADEDAVNAALRELHDDGYISQGVEWDWQLSTTSVDRAIDHPSPDEALCARSPTEIERMCSAILAYPYASGSELSARSLARWLLGDSDSYRAPGIDLRTLFCAACGWERRTYLHHSTHPKYCPECGEFESVSVEHDE